MRVTLFGCLACALLLSGVASAQEWIEFTSRDDRFTINFPRTPDVQEFAYATEYGTTLPARTYRVVVGSSRYAVTAVDYTHVRDVHDARLKGCKPRDANDCANPWNNELRGAMDFAVWGYLQKGSTVADYAYYNAERVEGRRLQLLNADGTRSFVAIHMHENRLYIIEGVVPRNSPPPALFQQSVGFIDAAGTRVRYESIYSNMYAPPARVQYTSPTVAEPDLSGMRMGETRTFADGPFAGQTWGVDGSGRPFLVRDGAPRNAQGLP